MSFSTPAKVKASEPTVLKLGAAGKVQKLVDEGKSVTAGETLVELDSFAAIGKAAADQRAECADERQNDPEHAEFERSPAEDRCAIDAAEGEQRVEPVLVEHARDQEGRDVLVAAHVGQGLAQGAQPLACRGRDRETGTGPVRDDEEEGQAEQDEPHTAERPADAHVLGGRDRGDRQEVAGWHTGCE